MVYNFNLLKKETIMIKKLFLTLILVLMLAVPVVPAFADGPVLVDAYKDTMLEVVADICETLYISTDNTIANNAGSVTLTEGIAGADYVIADGVTDGRELNVTVQTIPCDDSVTVDTWILTNGAVVVAYGPLTSKAVTSGQNYNFPETPVFTLRDATTP